jgi:hypothetical protein
MAAIETRGTETWPIYLVSIAKSKAITLKTFLEWTVRALRRVSTQDYPMYALVYVLGEMPVDDSKRGTCKEDNLSNSGSRSPPSGQELDRRFPQR